MNDKLARNKCILDICYYIMWCLILVLLAVFGTYQVGCMMELSNECSFTHTYLWAKPLAVLNILVWIVLSCTTITFVVMLQRRFAQAEFNGPRRKLIGFLMAFSLSFAVRATWDLVTINIDVEKPRPMAVLLFFVYFLTEWMPIFVIYLYHFWAFYEHYKMRNGDKTTNDTTYQLAAPTTESINMTKRDEFRMLLVNPGSATDNSSRSTAANSSLIASAQVDQSSISKLLLRTQSKDGTDQAASGLI